MNALSKLIARMQQPDFYPHTVVENIELVQTHASCVFLTGDYAYKIKKNVDYGFLNYSTLAKRKHFIEEELRLNKQIAPKLYLEVVAIAKLNNSFVFNNSENVVEYALKMRQFPQENLFSNLLKADRLSEHRFVELGKIVAQFHLSAKSSDKPALKDIASPKGLARMDGMASLRISSFGRVDKIRVAFTENYRQSQKYIGTVQTREQFEATKAYSDRFFNRRQKLLEARADRGKIKECHGDLHLKNICLWQNKIQLFDRIEFNESFRFVDTMYDVAFTVMDLDARERSGFANTFLNSYLEHSGDWSGLLVLPLYLSRQAYVRAKVNSFLLDDSQVGEADRQEARKNASKYYRQAYRYTKPNSGSLIIMSGLSGSGKSTVARNIARCKDAIQIRSDAVRKHLAGIPLDEPGTDGIYTPRMTQKTYDRLLELGTMLAKEGYTVILDAKYDRLTLRQPVIDQARANNIPLTIVHCTAPEYVLRDRLNQRQNDISDATADLIASQQKKAEAFTTAEQKYVIEVDTSQTNWQERATGII